jgi:hypothetical protein
VNLGYVRLDLVNLYNRLLFRLVRNLWKSIVSFVMLCLSVCPSIRPYAWNSSAPNERIFIKFYIFGYFSKICRNNSSFFNICENNGYFTWRPMYILIISCSVLIRMINVSDKAVEINKNTFMFNNFFFFSKSCCLWENVEKYSRAGQATDGNMAHAHYIMDN